MTWDTYPYLPVKNRGPVVPIPDTLWDITQTGFFHVPPDNPACLKLTNVVYVKWNKRRTARYALAVGEPTRHHPDRPRLVGYRYTPLHYMGAEVLHDLTPDDRVPDAKILRLLSYHAPYDLCMFCHHRPTGPSGDKIASSSDLLRVFGIGPTCARRAGFTHKTLQTLYRVYVSSGLDRLLRDT